jgi:TP901 family phage tail tape measure protein
MASIEEAVLRVKVDPSGTVSGAASAEKALDQMGKEAQQTTNELNKTTTALDKTGKEAKQTSTDVKQTAAAFDSLGGTLDRLKGYVAGALGSIAVGMTFKKAVDEVVEYEEALVKVTRITGYTTEEIDRFTGAIDDAVLSMPLAEANIMAIAEAGAKMGITATDDLAKFSLTMEKMAKLTGVSGKEAAQSILQLFQATGTSSDRADEFASVIVRLGKETRASEGDILSISQKLGAKGGLFNLAAEDVAGLSAGMASLGSEGKMAVGGVTQIMESMRDAVNKGGTELSNLGAIMGMTGDEAARAFKENATDAMLKFTEGLARANAAGIPYETTLGSIGSKSDALLQVVPVVASNFELMRRSVETARNEMGNATTLQDQMAQTSLTLGSRLEILGNTISEAFEEFKNYRGELAQIVDFASGVIRAFFGMESAANPVTAAMKTTANVLKGLMAGLVAFGALKAGSMFLGLAGGINKAGGAMALFNSIMAANPIGLIAVAIAGLIALYQQFKDETFQIGDQTYAVRDVVLAVWDTIRDRVVFIFETMYDVGAWLWENLVKGVSWAANKVYEFFKPVLEWWSENWKNVLDNVLGFIRKFVNFAIALLKSVIDVNVLLIQKIIEAGKAFGEIEFSSDPRKMIESFKRVGDRLGQALDPSRAWNEIKDKVTRNFETDFVTMGMNLGEKFVASFGKALENNPAFAKAARLFFGTGEIDNFLANLKRRQAESAAARAAAAGGGGGEFVGPPAPSGLGGNIQGLAPALTTLDTGLSKAEEKAIKTREALDELFAAIAAEQALIAQFGNDQDALSQARERGEAIAKAQALAEEFYGKNTQAARDEVLRYTEAFAALQRARIQVQAGGAMQEMRRSLEEERKLLGLSSDERERAIMVSKYETEALRFYGGATAQAKNDIEAFRQSIVALQQDRNMVETFQEAGQAIAGAFVDATFNARNLQDVMKGLIQQLTQIALTRLVMQPIMGQFGSALGGAFGAAENGAVFAGGRVTPFARGGIVNRPTMFPMGGGRAGLMGEAGPEAIMPLERDASGKLGVRGGGGGVTINVTTPDADSFRQSSSQIAARMRRLTGRG